MRRAALTGRESVIFVILAIFSVLAKLYFSSFGANYDTDSNLLISNLIREGKIVYAETTRYNYGPIWAYLVGLFRTIQVDVFDGHSITGFHYVAAFFLSFVDIALSLLLVFYFSFTFGLIFLLNPVSMLITGFHSQFDNLAVLVGFAGSVLIFKYEERQQKKNLYFILGLIVLGFSLMLKHILVFFPIWFLFRNKYSPAKRLALLTVPVVVFLLGFVPFIFDPVNRAGVMHNVFGYSSVHLTGFYPNFVGAFIPIKMIEKVFSFVPIFSGFKFVWFLSTVWAGYTFRHKPVIELFFYYLIAFCAFSSASADQYLAIPLIACAVLWKNPIVWFYTIMSLMAIVGSQVNIGVVVPFLRPINLTLQELGMTNGYPLAFLFVLLIFLAVKEIRKKSVAEKVSTA